MMNQMIFDMKKKGSRTVGHRTIGRRIVVRGHLLAGQLVAWTVGRTDSWSHSINKRNMKGKNN